MKTSWILALAFALIATAASALPYAFRYDVDKASSDWKVTFQQRSQVRVHTNPGYYPYHQGWYGPGPKSVLIVHPGQWLEGRVSSGWSRLSDADHR